MRRTFARQDLSVPPRELDGEERRFVGRLKVTRDCARFFLDGDDELGLDVVASDFLSWLDANVPSYVGSEIAFNDQVEFEGRLGLEGGANVIAVIGQGKLVREGEGTYSFWQP